MAKPGEVLYTEGHRYPRSRRTGGKEKEKSELEGRKYWKNKAEKLQKENLMLKHRIIFLELALNIWSDGQSELIAGQDYEKQFKNGIAKYDLEIDKNGKVINGGKYKELC